jgi:dihydrofolate reductase
MRKLTVITHVTLDGVMQAPARPDEDTRGGFGRGGWAQAGNDQVMADFMGVGRGGDPVALVLGRRTYQDFFGFWPHQPDNPYTESLTKQQKYVASRTLAEPLPWQNSTLLPGDAADAVAALKQEPGPDLVVLGSGELVGSLRPRALVDEYVLMIHPLILGQGRRLFPEGARADLRLAESVTTTTGVIIGRYQAR